jgi:nucleoside-diphosphate-sugar epimerase
MRVFVTGASGFIGSAVVPELLGAGHRVVALARSDSSAAALRAAGAEVLRSSLEDLESLRAAAASSEGVIQLAFNHDDLTRFAESAVVEARAIETIARALEGSGRPLVVATGTPGVTPGRAATVSESPSPAAARRAGIRVALAFAARGVRTSLVGLPLSVHGVGDQRGFVPRLIAIARERGVAGFVGDGANRWPAVHRLDAARVFRLALEKLPAGAAVHAVGDEGVPIRAIAEVMSRHLNVRVASIPQADASAHFGWLAPVLALDLPASSTITRELLGWQPTHPGLLTDLDEGHYFKNAES